MKDLRMRNTFLELPTTNEHGARRAQSAPARIRAELFVGETSQLASSLTVPSIAPEDVEACNSHATVCKTEQSSELRVATHSDSLTSEQNGASQIAEMQEKIDKLTPCARESPRTALKHRLNAGGIDLDWRCRGCNLTAELTGCTGHVEDYDELKQLYSVTFHVEKPSGSLRFIKKKLPAHNLELVPPVEEPPPPKTKRRPRR